MARMEPYSTVNAMEATVDPSAMLATSVNSSLVMVMESANLVRTNQSTPTTPTEEYTFQSVLTSAHLALTLLKSTPTAKTHSTQSSIVSVVTRTVCLSSQAS